MNIKLRSEINSGAALLLYTLSFFALTWMAHNAAVERLYPVAIGALTGAFGGFLVKRNSNNKIALEADKSGVCDPGRGASNG